jgi:hypothetical protein
MCVILYYYKNRDIPYIERDAEIKSKESDPSSDLISDLSIGGVSPRDL